MIELVAAALRVGGLEPTWEDVADTLWLAREIARHPPSAQAGETTLEVAEGTPSSPQATVSEPDVPEPPPVSGDQAGAAPVATLHLPPAPGTPTPRGGLPFHAPAATALPGALALGHALRPLKRRVPSATAVVLDEEATVDRAADEGIWAPVMRPELTRWLDLALVIDQSPSMTVWARTVEELRRLLERHGAFRDVRIWLLETDAAAGQAVLYAGTESATSRARPSTPRELIDPGGRRLILMVSDCVAPAWSSGAVPGLLALWGQTSPVVIVNMLPQRLWRYTAIETEPVELRAPLPGAPNARLEVSSWRAETERELKAVLSAAASADPTLREQLTASSAASASAVPVPVIALQRHWLAPWASLVAGAGGRKVPAVVMWAEPVTDPSPDALRSAEPEPTPVRLRATERVEGFRARFSPTAFELACYLAAVPLTLPIMRLVQQAMLPGAAQVHLAEVLLGGLLERLTPADSDVLPDEVQYDFADGVRELLQDAVPGSDILRILNLVGEFVGQRAGRTGTIPSLLLVPDETTARSDEERAFAAVTARTLRRFGASFEEFARRLEETARISLPKGGSPARPAGAIVHDNSRVFAVAVAELDGRPVAISGGDATIRVWDLASGRPVADPLAGDQDGSIYAYAVAAAELDGRPLIAAGGDDGIVRVWDLATSVPVGAPLVGREDEDEELDEVSALAAGTWQGRSMIISGGVSGTIRVWDLAVNQPLRRLIRGHSGVVSGVALVTLQGRPVIVSGSQDGTVGVWDLATGEPVLGPLSGHDYGVDTVAVGVRLGRQVIVSGSYDRTIRVWDLATGEPALGPLTGHDDAVYALAVAELGSRSVIVSGSGDHTVRVWDMASGEPVGEPFTGHTGPVNALATARVDGRPVVVSGGGDATVRIWDLASGESTGSPPSGHADIAVGESATADLEIGLRWNRDNDAFDVALGIEVTGENVDHRQFSEEPLSIDTGRLGHLMADEPAYGAALTQMLFGHADVKQFYMRARASTEGAKRKLRVRLVVSGPARYHALRWESLRDPSTGAPIATLPNVLWSRYVTSPDWSPIPALAGLDSALIVIAAPRDLQDYRPRERELRDVNLEEELARAQSALAQIPKVRWLERATLANMMKALHEGVDILYLVCHGALMNEGVPVLYLENPDRTVHPVDGRILVERLSDLEQRPTVVMLCSAQSASTGTETWSADRGELSALAPQIAAAGVAAVVAMQGNISTRTAATFTPTFFTALAQQGVLDEAMAVARRTVRDRPDWWAPVLFSRLRSGHIFTSGFAVRREETWTRLASQIKTGNFTPVIGPLLASGILGSRQDIARRWAAKWQMPLPVHAQDDLAQVAQYLSMHITKDRVRAELHSYLVDEIRERRNRATPDDLFWNLPDALVQGDDLTSAILEIGRRLRARDNGDPYRILAELDASLYLTTDWTGLLQNALMENGRSPTTMTFPWNDTREFTTRHVEPPTSERPLVYHLCGHLDDLDSLVLSEDDYFEWLNAWAIRRRSVPPSVLKALTNRPLLFLGYRSLGDWDFRIISQGIRNLGDNALHRHLHVAVLPPPQDPEVAQNFTPDWVSIYWGETRRFLNEVRHRIAT